MSPLVRLGTKTGSEIVKLAVIALYSLLFAFGLSRALPFTSIFLCALTLPVGKLVVSFVGENHKCLASPLALQYEGGLVVNPAFSDGLKGWYGYGNAYIELRNIGGNSFGVAFNRTLPYHSVSQPILLTEGIYYAFSAWVQIDKGSEVVVAAFRDSQNLTMTIGSAIAKSGCWSMIKGGLTPDQTMQANLYFQSMNTTIELWIDNVSLQSFTKEEWRNQQSESTNKTRKRNLRLSVSNKDGNNLQGINITVSQTRPQFPIGCAITKNILSRIPYQEWFTPRFTVTSFENEMKWYFTESVQGQENYTTADAMVAFARQRRVSVRGHNIVWDNPINNLKWARALSPPDLLDAARKRTHSVISRYKDEVIGWDVVNENMHFSFFENKTGPNASAMFYNLAQSLDPNNTMFLNEYNTLEEPTDMKVTPSKYLQKIEEIRSFPGNEGMVIGIGLQAHFRKPDIPYMRACLDILGASKMPIWITELDVEKDPNQTVYLEEIMREAFSHPAVDGIILWAAWKPEGCYAMCLTDNNFNNLDVGDVVDKLLEEWKTNNLDGVTNNNGVYESQVYHGEYLVTVMDPHSGKNITKEVNVTNESSDTQNVVIWI